MHTLAPLLSIIVGFVPRFATDKPSIDRDVNFCGSLFNEAIVVKILEDNTDGKFLPPDDTVIP
jgi:hypothetical protein